MRISVKRLKKEIARVSYDNPWLTTRPYLYYGVVPVVAEVYCSYKPSPTIQFRAGRVCSVWEIGEQEAFLGWISWEEVIPLIQKLSYISFLETRLNELETRKEAEEAKEVERELNHELEKFFEELP